MFEFPTISYWGMAVLSINIRATESISHRGPFQGLGGLKHFASSRPSLRSGFFGDRLGLGLASSHPGAVKFCVSDCVSVPGTKWRKRTFAPTIPTSSTELKDVHLASFAWNRHWRLWHSTTPLLAMLCHASFCQGTFTWQYWDSPNYMPWSRICCFACCFLVHSGDLFKLWMDLLRAHFMRCVCGGWHSILIISPPIMLRSEPFADDGADTCWSTIGIHWSTILCCWCGQPLPFWEVAKGVLEDVGGLS